MGKRVESHGKGVVKLIAVCLCGILGTAVAVSLADARMVEAVPDSAVVSTSTVVETRVVEPVPDSTEDSSFSAYGPPIGLNEVPPEEDAFAAHRPIAPEPWNRAVSLDLSLGSLLINTVFFPVKLAVGIVGAEIGGLAGAMNGGDQEAARGVWNVTTDGSYFVTPAALDGREQFTLGSDAP
ncbi:MAG TPA: hypothetical protein VIS07_16885 [Candidatus Binatia bacterium]